jgi:hypothetical protein
VTPGKPDHGIFYMPKNFQTNILAAPREQIIEQYNLPYFLRIAITRAGVTETHDFC